MITNITLTVVGLFGLGILFFSWKGSNNPAQWWRDAGLNLGTGLIASVILIFIYDKAQRKFDDIDKEKRLTTGIQRLSIILSLYFMTYLSFLYQEGLTFKDVKLFCNYQDMFDEDFFNRVRKLDLTSVCYFHPEQPTWLQHFVDMAKSRSDESFRFLSIYEPYFDCILLDSLYSFESPKFVEACCIMAFQLNKNLIMPPILPTEEMIDKLRGDIQTFLEIVDYCNKYIPDSANFYKNVSWWIHRSPANTPK